MKMTSVRFRLTLWNISVLAIVLFAFLLIAHVVVRSYLLSAIDHRLASTVERQNDFFAHFRAFPRPPAPQGPPPENRGWFGRNRAQRMIHLYDLEGRELDMDGTRDTTPEALLDRAGFARAAAGATLYTLTADAEPLRVLSAPLKKDGQQLGVVQAAVSFTETQSLLKSLTLILLLLVPCTLVLAAVGGLFLTNRALQPVRQIIAAAESLHSDDLSVRLPVVGVDEFAHLATTINRMLGRLDMAFSQLRESVERERQFTADASHELRTPLTAIKANTSLALRGERSPAQYREALQAIDQASTNMIRLVQDLLLLARSDHEQLTLDAQQVELQALVAEAIALTHTEAPHATVLVNIAEQAQTVWADPHHLQRVLVNLLENALRHTPASGEIRIDATAQADQFMLTVTDTGEGIAPEYLPHLRERFYRVDSARARRHGGTGLGLAICQSIIAAHQGTLDIQSTPGQGTRVTITLPATAG
ncbi:MAG TPA: ATP-binding protein [Armatimonadota bacterium]|jgi:heavy metal sensor kinase